MGLAKLTFDCRHGLIKFCSDPLETRGGCEGWGGGGGGNLGVFFGWGCAAGIPEPIPELVQFNFADLYLTTLLIPVPVLQ